VGVGRSKDLAIHTFSVQGAVERDVQVVSIDAD